MRITESDDLDRLLWGIPAFIIFCLLVVMLLPASAKAATGWHVTMSVNTGVPIGTVTMHNDSLVVYRVGGSGPTDERIGTASSWVPPGFDTTAATWGSPWDDSLSPFWQITVMNADSNFANDYAPAILGIVYQTVQGGSTEFSLPADILVASLIRKADTLTAPVLADVNSNGDSLAVQPDYWSGDDSTAYQGSASGLTATQVADSVWLSLVSARSGVAGSFGDSSLGWGATAATSLTATEFMDSVRAQGIAETGDAMTLTAAERAAIEDSIHANAADYKATGYAVAGDAMTLTPGERGSIEDSVHANAADYKATGYAVAGDAMTLTPAERGSIEDSVHANAADYQATGFAVAGDAMTLTAGERGNIEDSVHANAADYQADVSALALETTAQAAVDSSGEAYRAAALSALRWGMIPAGYDSTTTIYYPADGTSPKDSVKVFVWPGGSTVYTGYFHHTNTTTVADSLRTK